MTRFYRFALVLGAVLLARGGMAQGTNALSGSPIPTGLQLLRLGEVRNYQLSQESTRIDLSQGGVLGMFLPEPKLLSISGKKTGVVDIRILYVDGSNVGFTVEVRSQAPKELEELAAQLASELKPIKGVSVTVQDGRIITTGRASINDQKLYQSFIDNYGNQVVSEVTFGAQQSNVDVTEEVFEGYDGNALYTNKGSYQVGALSPHGRCILLNQSYAVFDEGNGRKLWLIVRNGPGGPSPLTKKKSPGQTP